MDVQNSPNMVMAGPGTAMNMNGADASAAAGLNATKSNWHYTGPALPAAEAQQLLSDGANGSADIHMAARGCSPEPTFSQQINATQYVQNTSQAVARYCHASCGDRWRGMSQCHPTNYPVAYYVNPIVMAANAAAKKTLDPNSDRRAGLRPGAGGGPKCLPAAVYILHQTR